jgi:hypothetical protein
MSDYQAFLAGKADIGSASGFDAKFMPNGATPLQEHLIDWSVRMGRCAIFADCGLGKTLMQLAWAANVVQTTNRDVLLLAPLAVTWQTAQEAEKFGIDLSRIVIANYEKLHRFSPNDFVGTVCDESSILKSFDGARRTEITEFMKKVPYRLLCTATSAPNEYIELGTSSEALGYLGHMDMLSRFFKNDQGNSIKANVYRQRGKNFAQLDDGAKWRFKGHAEEPFWKWVCSWARAVRRPSDLGFADTGFDLPPLVEHLHLVDTRSLPEGKLFALPAVGLKEQREERRRTIEERCEYAAQLINGVPDPAIAWAQLNDEGDLLESLIPDSVQVSGKDTDETKEAKFIDFLKGAARALVTKGRIGAWGLNFQHCAFQTMFPTHSFEEYYQCVRRSYRFGQKRPVDIHMIATDGEKDILANLRRKADAADRMFSELTRHMNDAMGLARATKFTNPEVMPSWL